MTAQNTLGEYLRARRELVDPGDLGLRVAGVRRTPGLRREEVATLAGISADYYLRLEQGRDRNPSPQVLEALARVFGLDATATEYLLSLAAPRPAKRRARPRQETVRPGIRQLQCDRSVVVAKDGQIDPFDVVMRSEVYGGQHQLSPKASAIKIIFDTDAKSGPMFLRRYAGPVQVKMCDEACIGRFHRPCPHPCWPG